MTVELLIDSGLRACRNPAAAPAAEPYGSARAQVLSQAGFDAAFEEVRAYFGEDFGREAAEQSSFLIDRLVERS